MNLSISWFLICTYLGTCLCAPDTTSTPKPAVADEEYAFVQTSGTGARPIARKDKYTEDDCHFETSHKLPPSLTYLIHQENAASAKIKREAKEAPAPAPAGAIKLDVQKLLAQYKTELKTESSISSSTARPSRRRGGKGSTTTTEAPQPISTGRPGRRRRIGSSSTTSTEPPRPRGSGRRSKKEAEGPRLTLTTVSPPPRVVDDDVVGSESEKQRSRIQIKKGPNGQEYEYEYVYYYYDEDDEKPTNQHDGPAKEEAKSTESNEVVPNNKNRGRQLGEEVSEERLPANTRFPPRSRNWNTTPLPEEDNKGRGRNRGRSTTVATSTTENPPLDNASDESQGTRGRTRANVRRPSLDLVDNASFNTHSNTAGAEPSQPGPAFPTELPAGPVRFLGATPNESVDPPEPIRNTEEVPEPAKNPMDKVALDLYAILQGTQKLTGEDQANDESSTEELTTVELTTFEETTTPSTTTTTTTTTARTTTTTSTTTTEVPIGRNRFKGRGRKQPSSTTEAAVVEPKPKSKFSRPSFGSNRSRARTTTEASEDVDSAKEESKSYSKPTPRARFGSTRSRTRTTAAPSEESATSASTQRSTRPRSSFNLRGRGRSTTESGQTVQEEVQVSSTTTRTRAIQAHNVRPLRPGPRINLRGRNNGHASSTTEAAVSEEPAPVVNSEEPAAEEASKEPDVVDNSPLSRLRNKHRVNVQPKAKPAATPAPIRRVNPLIKRRNKPEASSEAPQEVSSESVPAVNEEVDETDVPTSSTTTSTTEEPKGLNKLIAGRRRITRPANLQG